MPLRPFPAWVAEQGPRVPGSLWGEPRAPLSCRTCALAWGQAQPGTGRLSATADPAWHTPRTARRGGRQNGEKWLNLPIFSKTTAVGARISITQHGEQLEGPQIVRRWEEDWPLARTGSRPCFNRGRWKGAWKGAVTSPSTPGVAAHGERASGPTSCQGPALCRTLATSPGQSVPPCW